MLSRWAMDPRVTANSPEDRRSSFSTVFTALQDSKDEKKGEEEEGVSERHDGIDEKVK